MKFINPVYMLSEPKEVTDDAGDTTTASEERKVFVDKLSIGQSEFYQSHTNGFKPELKLKIRSCEYKNEDKLKCDGVLYKIIRTYDCQNGITELTCSRGVDHGAS